MTTQISTLGGRTIVGEIHHYTTKDFVEQRPIEEFFEKLDAVLEFPEVLAVQWEQYTPYFMDGDPCEFGTGEFYLKLAGDDREAGERGDGFRDTYNFTDYPEGYWDNHQIQRRDYNGDYRSGQLYYPLPEGMIAADSDHRVPVAAFNGKHDEINAALRTLAFSVRSHEIDLRKHFGDPARVTATADGFSVDYFDHD